MVWSHVRAPGHGRAPLSDPAATFATLWKATADVHARPAFYLRDFGCVACRRRPVLCDSLGSPPPLSYVPAASDHACEQRVLGQYGKVWSPEDRTDLPIRP